MKASDSGRNLFALLTVKFEFKFEWLLLIIDFNLVTRIAIIIINPTALLTPNPIVLIVIPITMAIISLFYYCLLNKHK